MVEDHKMSDTSRYMRQMVLPECGKQGQEKLGQAHILVIGAGGLGCPALQYLVAAGVGHITIVDGDEVERTNLHRQVLYREDQIGQNKAQAAKQTLETLNPEITFNAVGYYADVVMIEELIEDADAVLDCADSFAISYILSDACLAHAVPLISASALGLNGYVGGFCGGLPSLRALFPDLPERAANCNTAGVLGPVVGTIGCMQAQMTLNHLLGITPSPLGQCVSVDLKTFHLSSFRFDNAPEPEEPQLKFIARSQIKPDDFVVELRGEEEAPNPATPNAQRLNVKDFLSNGPTPQGDQRAVMCCKTGLRAWNAAQGLTNYWQGEIVLVAMGAEN